MSNHQHANGPSHHDQRRHRRNNHIYSSDHRHLHESEMPLHPPREPQSPYSRTYSRRRHSRPAPNDGKGYGGGTSLSFRGSHTPAPLRDLDRYSPYSPNASPERGPGHSYRNDPYPDEPRKLVDPSSRPSNFSNNSYKGGCPYTHASNERQLPQATAPSPRHDSSPLPNRSCDTSPLRQRDPRLVSAPYKLTCNSVSPIKQRPCRLKPETSSLAVPSPSPASGVSSLPDTLSPSPAPTPTVLTLNDRVQTDKKSSRTLSCETEETRDSHRIERHPPITHPRAVSTDHTANAAKQSEQARQNGSLPRIESESNQAEMRDQSTAAAAGSWQTAQRIFKKTPSRMPKWPDEEVSGQYAPPAINKDDRSVNQSKEVAALVEPPHREKKRPLLRSAPALPRISEFGARLGDELPNRTEARAIPTTHKGEHSETIPKNDCTDLNGSCSPAHVTSDAPHDSEVRKATKSRPLSASRQNLASSIANMKIVDRKEDGSASERERSQREVSLPESQLAGSNEYRQDRLLRGGNRGSQVSKRKATDFDGSCETQAKRLRALPSSETVNLDETTSVRRSKRLQSPETGYNKWETIAFHESRVFKLFSEQLRNQPMLLRLSFLGIANGDLRKTVDLWKGERGLPEPNQRRLEVNNNRIRRISGDMCECIAALRVVSLNFSCNLLTTIEGKVGLCSRLKFLNVSRNKLSSLPQELCDLTNLEVLNMSHNDISKLPSGLGRLKRLEVLSLAWNKLEVLPEDIAAEGAVLSDLDISHNEAFHFFPRCAEHWTKLEVLHMSNTTIFKSLSRRGQRLHPAALVKELAGRKEDVFKSKRPGQRSQSL